jgi:hypothetical protein
MAAQYDLNIEKGSNFDFWFQYLTESNIGINLSGYKAEMQIKRYKSAPVPEILVDITGLTYGYTGGMTSGISGFGIIYTNANYNSTSIDGGIRVIMGPQVTDYLNEGRYFYDFKLFRGQGATFAQRLVEGKITVNGTSS